jgi:hypothetical protein
MKNVRWNFEKAALLKSERGIEFERIAILIEENEYLAVANVPSRMGQQMFILDYDEYIVCVPFVETEEEIFLKTAYRNRKMNKHKKQEKNHA